MSSSKIIRRPRIASSTALALEAASKTLCDLLDSKSYIEDKIRQTMAESEELLKASGLSSYTCASGQVHQISTPRSNEMREIDPKVWYQRWRGKRALFFASVGVSITDAKRMVSELEFLKLSTVKPAKQKDPEYSFVRPGKKKAKT